MKYINLSLATIYTLYFRLYVRLRYCLTRYLVTLYFSKQRKLTLIVDEGELRGS